MKGERGGGLTARRASLIFRTLHMTAPSHTSASGVRKGGGAALAIMGLEWTGGGAHETFDKHTWSI